MQEIKEQFKSIYPEKYFLEKENHETLSKYLGSIGFLYAEEKIESTAVPGAGNMNFVIRVITDKRSFILKQSRPWVEKYPTIAAPIDRINIESLYFSKISVDANLAASSPKILHFDQANYILILEDLGEIEDYTYLYKSGEKISQSEIENLVTYLTSLHRITEVQFPNNLEMRKLNHEHIFHFPFVSDNGYDLEAVQEGLSAIAINEKNHTNLVEIIAKQGEIYLSNNAGVLLHGDFYPGSWMKADRLYVLDAEFAFVGPASFDVGVFVAHMYISQQEQKSIDLLLNKYKENNKEVDSSAISKFAGIEILRRLLGVAQLPVALSIEQKSQLIETAKDLILQS